jgi:hypothetical protein
VDILNCSVRRLVAVNGAGASAKSPSATLTKPMWRRPAVAAVAQPLRIETRRLRIDTS